MGFGCSTTMETSPNVCLLSRDLCKPMLATSCMNGCQPLPRVFPFHPLCPLLRSHLLRLLTWPWKMPMRSGPKTCPLLRSHLLRLLTRPWTMRMRSEPKTFPCPFFPFWILEPYAGFLFWKNNPACYHYLPLKHFQLRQDGAVFSDSRQMEAEP